MTAGRARLAIRVVCVTAAATTVGAVLATGLRTPESQGADSALPITREIDEPAPNLTGNTLQGKPFDLENLRGRVVVITVMASWCAPCRAELPELAAAAERFAPRDVQIVGLAMRDDPHDALALLRESNADRLLVVADPDGIRAVGLGARGVPETFVVDRDGKLRLHALGPITEQWLDKYLPMPAVT